jgi:hypothetical protein
MLVHKGNSPQPQAPVISAERDSVAVWTKLILCTVATFPFRSHKLVDLEQGLSLSLCTRLSEKTFSA